MNSDVLWDGIAALHVMGCLALFALGAIKGHMASDWFFTLLHIRRPDLGQSFGKELKPAWTFTVAGIEYEMHRHARFHFLIKQRYRSLGSPELVSAGDAAFRWYAVSVIGLIGLLAPLLVDRVAGLMASI